MASIQEIVEELSENTEFEEWGISINSDAFELDARIL
jgi:hypothetical protein